MKAEVADLLREYWRGDPAVVVLRERRRRERRRGGEAGGRRVGDRRDAVAVDAPRDLPRRLRACAARVKFARCGRARGREPEDVEADRLVVRFQGGEAAAFEELYARYFPRVYAYARVSLRSDHDAEDAAQQVFGNVVKALPRYRVREDSSFRAWLFCIARNVVLRMRETNGRTHAQEPAELERHLESAESEGLNGFDWLTDKDLAMLVGRLPQSQQQVLLLRYVFDFGSREIADVLGRTPVAIRMLEHRATRALEARLHALRGTVGRCDRSPALARLRPMPVLISRRFALLAGVGAPA